MYLDCVSRNSLNHAFGNRKSEMIFEKELLEILHNLDIFSFSNRIESFTFKVVFFFKKRGTFVFEKDPLLLIFLISKLSK